MILIGQSLCIPSPATVQELFSVARDANIIPDISLDPVLTTFLSLDSSAALQHQYTFLQRGMNMEQQDRFNFSLHRELGGSSRVTYGGVGVVALALSMLLDQVSQQAPAQDGPSAQRSMPTKIFGISTSSRIGWIISSYLELLPGIANDAEKMAETTELYDQWLKLELLDHYERMTTKKRMSSASMQQWLAGAAVHLHIRIHQVRLNSVPSGSVESLRRSYKTGLNHLVQGYTAYLRRNIQETGASGLQNAATRKLSGVRETSTSSIVNMNCSRNHPSHIKANERFNESAALNVTTKISCGGSNSRKTLNNSTRYSVKEEASALGLLIIEPWRNVSHNVQHHPCESPAIEQALVAQIIKAQDPERNRNFFLYPDRVFYSLLRQKDEFEVKTI